MTDTLERPTLNDAARYIKTGETVPNLHPMPISPPGTPGREQPRGVWRTWATLPTAPLMIRVKLDRPLDVTAHLDSVLGMAVMRSAPAPWYRPGHDAWVVPLPLALLGVVPLPHKHNPPRLPVWASTPFVQETPGQLEALCIGNADMVRELLGYVHEVEKVPCHGWTVTPAPLSPTEAREVIMDTRPLPSTHERFTPPYWHDWVAEYAPTGSPDAGKI